jgi:hypothetical protein
MTGKATMEAIGTTKFSQEIHHELPLHFPADFRRAAGDVKNPLEFQPALQQFCDDLRLWLEFHD